jgi:hypothetical protein
MESAPDIFYITDHYLDYPAVLLRLSKIRKGVLAAVLEESWRQVSADVAERSKRIQRRRT